MRKRRKNDYEKRRLNYYDDFSGRKVQIMGKGVGNISSLKKMTRGNHDRYSYISRQAMRYNIVQQSNWDTTPVDRKSGVVPVCTICNY